MGVRGTVPTAVRAATILAYVSAGLAFAGGAAINLALQLPSAAGFAAGICWVFMAAAIRTRRPYMRFAAAFAFGVGTLVTLSEPLNELLFQAYGATPDLIVFETVQWLPALAAVMLLWTREPAGYYRELETRTRQQTEQQREDRMIRRRAQGRRKRARQASAKSRTQSRH